MKKKLLRRLVFFVLLAFCLLGITLLVIAYTNVLVHQFAEKEPAFLFSAQKIQPTPTKAPDSLKVVDWNIKFAGGRIDFFFDCYGDRVLMTEEEVMRHLEGLAAQIRKLNPDILLLQEVDIDSKRSANIHQLQWLLDHTDLNYGAYASHWQVSHIPSRGLGRMNSGIAILSKYPLTDATRHALPQMEQQDALTRFFYLRRAILQATVQLPGHQLVVLNTHLEAYDQDGTKKRQLDILQRLADSLSTRHHLLVGGDLNTLPPGARKRKGFDDAACKEEFVADDYTREGNYLKPWYARYREAIPLANYLANESRYYGHTVNGKGSWNRRLDYLFSNRQWGHGTVHQNTHPLSDHAPLSGWLYLNERQAVR